LTPAGAVRAIAGTSLLVTLASGLLIHLLDREEFPTLGGGLWWAAQTVTTVGYGDAVPEATSGRIVAVYVMLAGIALITVATAAISARLIESARRAAPASQEPEESALDARLAEIVARLDRIECAMQERRAA
jgi:voltage-gated potassium channel